MKFEKSCGAIILKIENEDLFVLLVKQINNEWGFPKGHVENHDLNEYETAIREVKEETNLDIKIYRNSPIYKSIYTPFENCKKEVLFFVSKAISNKIKQQHSEVSEIRWVNIEKANDLLTHEINKKILKKAVIWFNKNIRNINHF